MLLDQTYVVYTASHCAGVALEAYVDDLFALEPFGRYGVLGIDEGVAPPLAHDVF